MEWAAPPSLYRVLIPWTGRARTAQINACLHHHPQAAPDYPAPTLELAVGLHGGEENARTTHPARETTPAPASSPQSTGGGGRPLLTSAMAAEEATLGAQQEDGSRGYTVSTNNGDALALKPAPTITVYTHLCTSH